MTDAAPPLRSSPPPGAAGANEAEPVITEKAGEPTALSGLSANELLLRGNFRKVRAQSRTERCLFSLFFCFSGVPPGACSRGNESSGARGHLTLCISSNSARSRFFSLSRRPRSSSALRWIRLRC
jgi:hypothetical protein